MPGLLGWIHFGPEPRQSPDRDAALLSEMAQRMSHTGDELVDTWTDPPRGFAIARVGPRHLAPLPWPAADGPSGARAFLDGVVHGDPAQVVERARELARRGPAALASLRGFFSAARWEPGARRLLLATDRRASRPIVTTVVGSTLYFAPEVKALLAVPGVDKSLDEAAVGVFLGAGYLLAQQTLFNAIRRLAGGDALVVEPGRRRLEAAWRYRLDARGDGTRPRDLEEELAELVRGAVERNLGDVDRTVVFLSGGVDSRAIAEAAQGAARRRGLAVRTVTWSSPEPRPGSDLEVAGQVADALGTRHRSLVRRLGSFGARLTAVNYLLDGLTDVAAYHPHEYALMGDLAASGARAVLRGDECFGWGPHVASLEEAVLSLNLRALGPLRMLDRLVRPRPYARWCEASQAALDDATRPLRGEHPDDAKDLLYFRHRLQGYLGSAAYLKQVVLDHRAPLVDEAILDFNARVPAELRVDKRLFQQAAARGAPDLWRIPLARRGNLEDWGVLLASDSPVRRHVELELRDAESGLWELFDRRALLAALPPIGRPAERRPAAIFERGAKRIARAALRVAPPIERRLAAQSHRAGIRFEQICLRVMILKSWHDLFVTGDGSRRALEERLGAALSQRAA
jgi:asparagine synthetase B (glutamine-hydrolysing)